MSDASDAPSVDALIESCRGGDTNSQISALQSLRDLQARQAVPVILPLLIAEDEFVRGAAADALGELGDGDLEHAGPALVRLLHDPEEHVRNTAAESLARLRYGPARPELERMLLADEYWVARASAAEALGELGDARALGALEAALADEYYPVRAYAAYSIGQLGDERQLPIIQRSLESEHHPQPRSTLLVVALRFGDESVFDELLSLLSSVDEELAHDVLASIEDLLTYEIPSIVVARAAELSECLGAVRATGLQARLTELCERAEHND